MSFSINKCLAIRTSYAAAILIAALLVLLMIPGQYVWMQNPFATISVNGVVDTHARLFFRLDGKMILALNDDDSYVISASDNFPNICNVSDTEIKFLPMLAVDSNSVVPCENMPGVEVLQNPHLTVGRNRILFISPEGKRVIVKQS